MFSWWPEDREWCCPSFRELHEARHERGLFIFVRPAGWASTTAPSFWVAFRSVRQQDLSALTSLGLPRGVPVTISTYRRIAYCPGCGVELGSFYLRSWERLLDPVILREFESSAGEASGPAPGARADRDG